MLQTARMACNKPARVTVTSYLLIFLRTSSLNPAVFRLLLTLGAGSISCSFRTVQNVQRNFFLLFFYFFFIFFMPKWQFSVMGISKMAVPNSSNREN